MRYQYTQFYYKACIITRLVTVQEVLGVVIKLDTLNLSPVPLLLNWQEVEHKRWEIQPFKIVI